MATFMIVSISLRKVVQNLGLDLVMDHPKTHLMEHNRLAFILSLVTTQCQAIHSLYHRHTMGTLRRLAHIQVQYIRRTTTASTRWDHIVQVSGGSQSELHKHVILAGNVRPNAMKVDQNANIARTTISSAFTETCLFRSRTNKRRR